MPEHKRLKRKMFYPTYKNCSVPHGVNQIIVLILNVYKTQTRIQSSLLFLRKISLYFVQLLRNYFG